MEKYTHVPAAGQFDLGHTIFDAYQEKNINDFEIDCKWR